MRRIKAKIDHNKHIRPQNTHSSWFFIHSSHTRAQSSHTDTGLNEKGGILQKERGETQS